METRGKATIKTRITVDNMTYKVGDIIHHRRHRGCQYLVIGSDRYNYFLEVMKGSGFRWWQVWHWHRSMKRREKTGQFKALYKGTVHRHYRSKGLLGGLRPAAQNPGWIRFSPPFMLKN